MKRGFIKLFDGFIIEIDGEQEKHEHISDILEQVFGWDLENDPNARECFSLINREMFCFHYVDLSPMTNFEHKVLIIGIESNDEIEWEEVEEE